VWLYYRFGVSLRDVSELMLARGTEVSHKAIRLWTLRFGTEYARRLRRTRGACSNIWHLDELCLMINGERGWLWRAVDDAGEVLANIASGQKSLLASPAGTLQTMRAVIRTGAAVRSARATRRDLLLETLALRPPTRHPRSFE
jgi:putative transposase